MSFAHLCDILSTGINSPTIKTENTIAKKYISKKHSFHLPRQQSPDVFINGDSENTICLEEPKDPQAAFAILVVGMLFRAAAQTITN